MKASKIAIILAAALLVFGLSSTSYAFHSGGVAECMGCHQMHNAPSAANLLVASDQSSACLTCHGKSGASSYHIATPDADMPTGTAPGNMTPGGDFGWIKKTYTYDSHGTPATEEGDRHGHNIVAKDFGYNPDATNATAPGGTMNALNLACNSCHDQHGQVRMLSNFTFARTGAPIIGSGSYGTSKTPAAGQAVGTYRLLRSTLSDNTHASGTVSFINAPVVAFAPGTYNRSEGITMTRVEYNDNMSKFCGSCHADMHLTTGIQRHPQDIAVGSEIYGNYNSYVKSGDLTGSSTTSYLSLVPFEQGKALDATTLPALKANAVNNDTKLTGMESSGAKVMCLSCHRAHASGFLNMTRWENESEFIISNGLWPAVNGKSTVEEQAAMYNFPTSKFSTYQRSLCNKCHAKD